MRNPLSGTKYANVAATLALVVACGGTSYAAATIGTSDIQKGAVTAPKIKNGAVKTNKIKPNAVSSTRIRDNAVRGTDVNESTLGQVPSAADVPDVVMQSLTPHLKDGWTSAGEGAGPTFGKSASGVVHLSGSVKKNGPFSVIVAELPGGFRPSKMVRVPAVVAGGPSAWIAVRPGGQVEVHLADAAFQTNATTLTSLDVSFIP